MLFFFPKPYPDELWYSVLCRYHVRTGNSYVETTKRDLFQDDSRASMGSFFPTNSIKKVVDQLPKGIVKMDDVILKHTLFPYLTRIYPIEKKREMFDKVKTGTFRMPSNIWKATKKIRELKACPDCMKEDKEQFGESYWHVEHQIPHMKLCRKHDRPFMRYPISGSTRMKERFIFPEECEYIETKDSDITDRDRRIAEALASYQTLPFEIGPTKGYNNLYQALVNRGYVKKNCGTNYSLDYEKIYKDLELYFGKEEKEEIFGKPGSYVLLRLRDWKLYAPDKYAYLSVFLEQSPIETFGTLLEGDKYLKKLKELESTGILYGERYVAECLNMSPDNLNSIAKRFGIRAFWDTREKIKQRTKTVVVYFSEDEKEEICERAEDKHYRNLSAFIRDCTLSSIRTEK